MSGVTENFNVRVGLHKRSALGLCLFSVAMNESTKEIQGEVPRCMMFADDIVLVEKNLE